MKLNSQKLAFQKLQSTSYMTKIFCILKEVQHRENLIFKRLKGLGFEFIFEISMFFHGL